MNDLHFPNLTIKGFRGIRELTIPQLGRVNLITGKNNTGKSSVLEALQLFANNAAPWVIHDTLEFREEDASRNKERQPLSDSEGMSYLSALFCGFPEVLEKFKPISISTDGKSGPKFVEMRMDRISLVEDDEEGYRYVESESQYFNDSDSELALVVNAETHRRLHRLVRLMRNLGSRRRIYSFGEEGPRMPCELANPYSGETYS